MRRGPLGAAALLGLALTTLSAESARIERGSLVLDGLPEIPTAFAERLNQYQQTRSASLEGWLADSSLLIGTRFGETAQLHRGRNTGLRWARSGERFAYSTTRRNGRDADIHVMDRATRVSRPVLEAEGSWSVLD